jgi:hypothetical protein
LIPDDLFIDDIAYGKSQFLLVVVGDAPFYSARLLRRRRSGMSQSQLPVWVQYAQALGAPLLAVVIGGFGAWIAFQQMRLARIKVQHDTYDRKYAVFLAVRWVLTVVAGAG